MRLLALVACLGMALAAKAQEQPPWGRLPEFIAAGRAPRPEDTEALLDLLAEIQDSLEVDTHDEEIPIIISHERAVPQAVALMGACVKRMGCPISAWAVPSSFIVRPDMMGGGPLNRAM
jgi:hypothetical protein